MELISNLVTTFANHGSRIRIPKIFNMPFNNAINLFQTASADAATAVVARPGAPPSPPALEIDPGTMTRVQAIIIIQGLDPELVRSVSAAFKFRPSRQLIVEALDAGILASTELRRLVVAAEVRNLRTSTLIQIIMLATQE